MPLLLQTYCVIKNLAIIKCYHGYYPHSSAFLSQRESEGGSGHMKQEKGGNLSDKVITGIFPSCML